MENLVRWKFISQELRFKGKLVEVTYKIKNKVEVLAKALAITTFLTL
jgi:hypothetical protein